MFLELVREVSVSDAALAADALVGLRAYQRAPHSERAQPKPEVARVLGASLRDHGGKGPPLVLVPSLINPPRILDLDEEVSLAAAIARLGRRTFLLDWGKSASRAGLTVREHVEMLLLPLLRSIDRPAALVGYCLGGTMAIAAANLIRTERVATLAAPWNFARYSESSSRALSDMWQRAEPAAKALGALPMEVLQAAFWSLDPERTVRKFAQFGALDQGSAEARRFVELEEWANEGEPLPYPAATELVEDLFGLDLPGSGKWMIGGEPMSDRLSVPSLHLTSERDLIAPPQTAARGDVQSIASGHVGMIVGSARNQVLAALKDFLAPCR